MLARQRMPIPRVGARAIRREGALPVLREPNIATALPSGREEMIPHTYHSTRRLPTTSLANQEVIFFNYTVGQTIDGVSATEVDTNIRKPNAVEQPNRFWIHRVDFVIIPSGSLYPAVSDTNAVAGTPDTMTYSHPFLTDLKNICETSRFSLKISVKDRLTLAPIYDLLATSQLLPQGFSIYRKGFVLRTPELLPPEIPFIPSLNFGSDMPVLSGVCKVICRLHGQLIRLADM